MRSTIVGTCIFSMLSAQTLVFAADAPATKTVVPPKPIAVAPPTAKPISKYVVHLGVDGNLPGRVGAIDKTGRRVPVRAAVQFIQDGQTLNSTSANEGGNFQAVGLLPGTYTVTASSGAYYGVFAVRVVAYTAPTVIPEPKRSSGEDVIRKAAFEKPDEAMGEDVLELTLAPNTDLGQDEADDLAQVMPVEMMSAAACCGGGGHGGGLGGALLGLAGLVGLVGLAGLGGTGNASPHVP